MNRNRDVIEFVVEDDDGEEVSYAIPAVREVCPTCDGKGSHVNRNIDGNGISPEEFAADPDFEESYFRGDYDVPCEQCHGANVISVPDERAAADPRFAEAFRLYREQEANRARWEAEDRYTRWMESGGRE